MLNILKKLPQPFLLHHWAQDLAIALPRSHSVWLFSHGKFWCIEIWHAVVAS
jgi:hypothetical protein